MNERTMAMARSVLPRTRAHLILRVTMATDKDRPTTLALMRLVKERYLSWPVSRVTRARVEAVLLDCGFYQDTETGFWYDSPKAFEETHPGA